jgi:hypothetical protein
MITTAEGAIGALDLIEQFQPKKLQEAAEKSSAWPVLLNLNSQDIKYAKERLGRLKVGTKSLTPKRPGQRLDSQNFWTLRADEALKVCADNRAAVPILEDVAAGSRWERTGVKYWQTQIDATLYEVSRYDHILITDWERECVKLPAPITVANFKQWWSVVQLYVIERWHVRKDEYEAALSHFSDRTAPKESTKRNLAMSQMRKALWSLVGLR